jgi:hypothetical protein
VIAHVAAACADVPTPGPYTTQRDSAGVIIVENIGPLPSDGGGWSIGLEPSLSIGAVEGDSSYQFFGISGAHRTLNGEIVVVNAGSRSVRVYDVQGVFLRTFGQRGSGPEEFEMPVLAGAVHDTLIIVDARHHRLTMVHPESGIARVVRVADDVGGFLNPAGTFGTGEVVFGGAMDMGRTQIEQGLNRAHTFYRSCGPDGSLVTDFGHKMGADFYVKTLGTRGVESRPMLVPFGRVPLAAVSGERFFFGSGDAWEIEAHDVTGTLLRLIRYDRPPVPVTGEHVSEYVDDFVANFPTENQARMRQLLAEIPVPETFPPYGGLAADLLGYLWVADYDPPGDVHSAWTIFDRDGAVSGRVMAPQGFSVLEIGGDYILGVYRDDMGVEYLRQYSLQRPEAP